MGQAYIKIKSFTCRENIITSSPFWFYFITIPAQRILNKVSNLIEKKLGTEEKIKR